MKVKTTLHFYAKSTRSNAAGLFPIYVRLTVDGKRLEYSTKNLIMTTHYNTTRLSEIIVLLGN